MKSPYFETFGYQRGLLDAGQAGQEGPNRNLTDFSSIFLFEIDRFPWNISILATANSNENHFCCNFF